MKKTLYRTRLSGCRAAAFTLVETVLSLTIVAILAALAIPTLKGLRDSEKARAPVAALAELVQEVRSRAVRENRPYQIVFERSGVHAMAGNRPFADREELLGYIEELRTPPVIERMERTQPEHPAVERQDVQAGTIAGGAATARPQALPLPGTAPDGMAEPEMPWTESIALKEKTECAVLLWGDPEWDPLQGDKLRTWVFQPSGMLSPARVRLLESETELEATFDGMTGELTAESVRPATSTASL